MSKILRIIVRVLVYACLALAFAYIALTWANAWILDYYAHRTWNEKQSYRFAPLKSDSAASSASKQTLTDNPAAVPTPTPTP